MLGLLSDCPLQRSVCNSFYTVEFLQSGEFHDVSIVVGFCTVAMLTAEEFCALNRHNVTLPRAVRKTIFRLRLWQTGHQRLRLQRCFQSYVRRRHTTRAVVVFPMAA